MADEPARELAPLRVAIEAERAARFAQETGFSGMLDAPPLSYPAIWIAAPQIREAVAEICAETDSVPVHESQRFTYEAPLRFGVDYVLRVTLRRQASPPRLAIGARLASMDGAPIGEIDTLLRLIPRSSLRQGAGA